MYTLFETPIFSTLWPRYWTEEEYGDFCAWLARNPYAGDVIKQTGGCRKVLTVKSVRCSDLFQKVSMLPVISRE